jgi:hypothetical protein
MKKLLSVLCLLGLVFAAGCGGGGGGTGVTIPVTNTTVAGTITVPAVSASGITSDITYANDTTLLANFAKSGICTVNGKQMAFSLATATRYFYVFDITPADQYDIRFTYQNFTLRSLVPHTSTAIVKNLDLNTTAEALLFEQYAFTPAKIKSFEINPTLKEGLAQKMLTWLQTPTMTRDAYQTAITAELASFSVTITPVALGSDLTPARDLTGTWKGSNVVYYEMNIFGERMVKNTANMTLTLTQTGSAISGVLDTTIVKYEKIANSANLFVPPVSMNSLISGKVSSTNLTFTARNFSGAFTFTSDLMQGTLKNTDTNSYLGVESEINALKLMRQ